MFFRVMIEGPQTDMNMDILRDVGLVSCFGWEVEELDSGELEGGDGMFDFRLFRMGPDR